MSDYESQAAESIRRLADMVELMADAMFAIAGGIHTDSTSAQRDMAAVFKVDALDGHKDVLRRLTKAQRANLSAAIVEVCKAGKRK